MREALRIARKDLLRSVRDKSALAVTIVAPLALAFILNSVLPDQTLEVTYGYVNEDRGDVSTAFIEEVLPDMEFAEIRELDSRAIALGRTENDEIAAAFVLPEGLTDAVRSGRAAEIEVITSPDSEIGAAIATAIAEGYAAELNAVGLTIATATVLSGEASPPNDLVQRVQEAARAEGVPVSLADTATENREFDDKTFFAAGMAVFFLFFTTQFGAQSLLRERREGTLARMLSSPVSRGAVIAGKALFTFVLGLASMVTLIVATALLMGAEWGDPLPVAALVVAAVFAAIGVQSVVTTFAKTDEQAGSIGSVVAVTLGLLGGTFFPLSQAPGFVATLSYITPHAWVMRGLGDLSGGASGLGAVTTPLVALFVIGGVTGTIALVNARRIVAAG